MTLKRPAPRARRGRSGCAAPVARERAACAADAPLPAVRDRERAGVVGVDRVQRRGGAQPLALVRRPLDRQVRREIVRRTVARATSSGSKHGAHVVPERARLARAAVVGRRLAHEHEPLRRAGARGVEEVAVAARPDRARRAGRAALVEPAPARRRGTGTAPLAAAACPARDPARRPPRSDASARAAGRARRPVRSRRRRRPGRPCARARRPAPRRRAAPELQPALELVEHAAHGVVRAQVGERRLSGRRRFEAVRVAQHLTRERANGRDGIGRVANARAAGAERRREAGSSPPRLVRRRPPRGRADAPRRSRRSTERAPRRASAGTE